MKKFLCWLFSHRWFELVRSNHGDVYLLQYGCERCNARKLMAISPDGFLVDDVKGKDLARLQRDIPKTKTGFRTT